MAGIAKIEGEVIVAVTYSPDGLPKSARALTGPPQLRPTAEHLCIKLKLPTIPKEIEAPWVSFLSLAFNVKARTIEITPTSTEKIPPPESINPLNKTAAKPQQPN